MVGAAAYALTLDTQQPAPSHWMHTMTRDELIARMAKTKDEFGYQPGDDPTVSVV